MMIRYMIAAAALLALVGVVPVARAGTLADIYTSGKQEFGADFAAGGYDVVAYQTEGAPKAGSAEYAFEWKGATWRFSSKANLEAFKAEPTRYAPQFGGYCAYGVSQGAAVHGDPKFWAVVDGKLYLNINSEVQGIWNKDRAGYIKGASTKWPSVLNQ